MDRPKLIPLPLNENGNADEKMRQILKDMELDTLARTIWGGLVVKEWPEWKLWLWLFLNRVAVAQRHGGYWWEILWLTCAEKPINFPVGNKQDPNLPRLLSVGKDNLYFVTNAGLLSVLCLVFLKDQTKGQHIIMSGLFLLNGQLVSILGLAVIGRHLFYKLAEDQ